MNVAKTEFTAKLMEMDVFDTHSHLVGNQLPARDFWEIGEYFWLLQELNGAGYPLNASELDEDERMKAYAKAFKATRNTAMNWVVSQITENLYGIKLDSAESIKRIDKAIRETAAQADWSGKVLDKLAIRHVVVNYADDADFKDLPDVGVWLPRIDNQLNKWIKSIYCSLQPEEAANEIAVQISELLLTYKQQGARGFMTTLPRLYAKTWDNEIDWSSGAISEDDALIFILHKLSEGAEKNELFFQMFLGMERGWSPNNAPVNDPGRVVKLHGLFEMYRCDFELIVASSLNNMDVVQAAKIFPNVYAGGLWWYNFRPSTFNEIMQQRFEALAPEKSSLIVSDARCVEWCYGKTLLVKKLMADYLFKQIEAEWIDEEEAFRIASEWLYEGPSKLYRL